MAGQASRPTKMNTDRSAPRFEVHLAPKAGARSRTVVLGNGLRVVVAPLPQLHRAHVALWARVGSRFETRVENGISHFLEHMLYRGTKRLPHLALRGRVRSPDQHEAGPRRAERTTFSAYGDALDNTPDLELPDPKVASPDTSLLVSLNLCLPALQVCCFASIASSV